MASICFAPMWPLVMRFTKVDSCGNPVYGPTSTFVTDAFSQVEISAEIEEGAEYLQRKANGAVCVSSKQPDSLKWWLWTIDFCQIDPELWANANDKFGLVHDYLANVVGWDQRYDTASNNAIAVEMWTKTQGQIDSCDNETSQGAWGYVAGFKLVNARVGDTLTFSGEPNPFQMVATSDSGSRWGKGPYPIQINEGEPPSPGPFITPVPSDHALRVMVVDVAPPEPQCGGQPLNNPDTPGIVVTRGDTPMDVCVRTTATEGSWVIDWGDGSPIQPLAVGEEPTCHTFTREDTFTVGVWQENNKQSYTSRVVTVPQTMAVAAQPSSGAVPLDVELAVTGATDQPVVNWGD